MPSKSSKSPNSLIKQMRQMMGQSGKNTKGMPSGHVMNMSGVKTGGKKPSSRKK